MAAAAALADAGHQVDLFEARPFLGGRATSFPLDSELIDNCQHILLGCCVNLLDFYRRLGVAGQIRFHREFHFLEPGGRLSTLRRGRLPAPLHFAGSFWGLRFLDAADKLAIARGLLALRRERSRHADLDSISMLDWLRRRRQPPRAIARFWRPVLVSAVNEEPDRLAAAHGFQVFRLGFLAGPGASRLGLPAVPLAELYQCERLKGVSIHLRAPLERILVESDSVRGVLVAGRQLSADYYVCALPFERVPPEAGVDVSAFEHSPITGIHLWFDRPVTNLPYAALLDRTIQWFFNKGGGKYLLLVVSASRGLIDMSRSDLIALALGELAEFLPRMGGAKLEKAHVIKEIRATFSARPGLERLRPPSSTSLSNLFLAGDWTRSGWPATMEGAVRSGYLAAEAVSLAAGQPRKFLLPDLA